MIDTKQILSETYPDLKLLTENSFILNALKKLIHEQDVNNLIRNYQHLNGYDFLNQLLSDLNFNYQIRADSCKEIPATGRLLIIANHPIGTLDGLALVKFIRTIRPDVRIVANKLLLNVDPLQAVFLPVEVMTDKKNLKDSYKAMLSALKNEEALIIFPAGEVSRLTSAGISDGEWQTGFIKLAKKNHCPILPIHISAKNSLLFYGLSLLYRPLGAFLLFKEMYNKRNQTIIFSVGQLIQPDNIAKLVEADNQLSQRMRQHVLSLSKNATTTFLENTTTELLPPDKKAIKTALTNSRLLGETRDGKKIFLYQYQANCPAMLEIARLRELTFQAVGEGTGQVLDMDAFDSYYQHIVLWDDIDLNIVGAYRIGDGPSILASKGLSGFYTHTLFDLNGDFAALLPYSIELGRSFVQPAYWGQHSLEYLWYGIGAYLRERTEIKYLFGTVSMSNSYPQPAKELIIGFYQQQFGTQLPFPKARTPFVISAESREFAAVEFNTDYASSFKILNSELKKLGVKVPMLYKQYAELCLDDGCHFIDYNVDPAFNNCIDSLIMLEVDKITPKKRQRFIEKPLLC